jgi:uncharacterized protein
MRLAACLLVASLLASACSVRSPAVEYWTLAALTPAPAAWDEAGPAVAIGPVALPRHLDRPQVLVRHDAARVEPAGLHRWADPLDDGLGRVLAANLGRSLGSQRVSAYPVQPPYALDYRVHLDVERFDGRPGAALVLSARWVITGAAGWPGAGGRAQRHRGSGRRELRVLHRRTFARRGGTRGADRRQAQDVVRGLGAPRGPVVGVRGFEPPTFCSRSRRATRLRYTPYSVR